MPDRAQTEVQGEDNDGRALYDRFVRPLEQQHWGEYVVVTPSGQYVLGESMVEAAERGLAAFGRGHWMFRVGPRAVGTIG